VNPRTGQMILVAGPYRSGTGDDSEKVIVGSSAAALTGLQFVVIVLAAEMNALGGVPTTQAFATPTVVHFCAALLISAIMSAPWHGISSAGFVVGACGVAGLAYVVLVVSQLRRQIHYVPVLEDWIWHGALPFAALYGASDDAGPAPMASPSISVHDWRDRTSLAVHWNPQRLGCGHVHRAPAASGAGGTLDAPAGSGTSRGPADTHLQPTSPGATMAR
jgi:hypothetical protein